MMMQPAAAPALHHSADVEHLEARLVKACLQALGILEGVMNDAANRPKEAYQAARLLLQKVNLLRLLGRDTGNTSPSSHLAKLQAMAQQLEQVTATVAKKGKNPHRYDAFLPKKP